jgi:methionine-rich copper-binding protein CopC/putative copper export protein
VRIRLVALAAVAVALAVPSLARAHARLLHTSPANGSVIAAAPHVVRVTFDDVVRVGPGIEAVQNGGASILAGSPRVESQHVLVIPLRAKLRHGPYSVRWSIVSDDGHLESGVIAFAVGRGQPAPTSSLVAESTGPNAADVVSRWLFYAGLLAAVGIGMFALVVRPRDEERVALVLSSACVLAAIGGGEEAHRVGLSSRAGLALGTAALVAIVVGTIAGAATLERRLLRPALIASLALPLAPALAGHAFDRGVNRFNVAADALHVLGAATWVGALLGIVLFREAPRRRSVVLAGSGVVLLGITGVVRAWSELVSLSQLWHTSYGRDLLVKTAILLAALGGGWLLRAHVRERAGTELLLVAGLLVAVSILVLLPPGRSVGATSTRVSTAEPSPSPPLPPPGAVLVAKELGPLGVALELGRSRTTAIVLSPAGGGLSGLDVQLDGTPAAECGSGCYTLPRRSRGAVDVQIDNFGPTLRASFAVPTRTSDGTRVLRMATARYRALRSVLYVEQLSSAPGQGVTALWRLEAPNRVSYQIPGGAAGVVIGPRRWDRATSAAKWVESAQTLLPQPATQWSSFRNAHVIQQDTRTVTVTFVDPSVPAYFEATFDPRTLLPRTVHMTASAHFMVDRYVNFNAPREIRPPR